MNEQRADTKPYGNVEYADPGYQADKQHRYPIDTADHVRAAWSYINMPKNADKYTAEQLAAIKGRIKAAAKRFGVEISDSGRSGGWGVEKRYTRGLVEVRVEQGRIGGYAAMFNRPSENLGGFVEQVMPTAFNRSRGMEWPGVVARFNHDDNVLLGTTAANTLRLRIDDAGLDYDVKPPQSRADIVELVERGDIRHSSFAFRVVEQQWSTTDQGFPQRSLVEVGLVDVAPVITPAYPDTTAALRSLAELNEVDLEEVVSRAVKNELRSFFVRTDVEGQPKKRTLTLGAAARLDLLARERDPWV